MNRIIRRRATAIVIRESKVLPLREPQDTKFHLPGGRIEVGEIPESAVKRELHEETRMATLRADHLFDFCDYWAADETHYWGQVHSVFDVNAAGEVALSDEHCEFIWWNGATRLPLMDYVKPMLDMLQGASEWRTQE